VSEFLVPGRFERLRVRSGGRLLPDILGLSKSRVLYGRVRANFLILGCPRPAKPHSMRRATKFRVRPLSLERSSTLQTPLRAGSLFALRELRVNPRSRGFQVEKQPSPAADWCPGNPFLPTHLIGDAALDADEGTEKPLQPWDAIATFTPEVKTATRAGASRMAFGSSGNMLQFFEVHDRTSVVK
jgi:hypothetical protein